MKIKKGDVVYQAYLEDVTIKCPLPFSDAYKCGCCNHEQQNKCGTPLSKKLVINEWHCTSVRKKKHYDCKFAFFSEKIHGLTWVKLSKKHGDFGFKNVPHYCKKYLQLNRPLKDIDLHKTKIAAKRSLLSDLKREIKEDYYTTPDELKMVERHITRLTNYLKTDKK